MIFVYLTKHPITLWPATQPSHHPNSDLYTSNAASLTLGILTLSQMTLLQYLQWRLFYKWLFYNFTMMTLLQMTLFQWWLFYKWLFYNFTMMTLGLSNTSWYLDGCHVFKDVPLQCFLWSDTSSLELFLEVVLESSSTYMQTLPGETNPRTKQYTLQLTSACKTHVSA